MSNIWTRGTTNSQGRGRGRGIRSSRIDHLSNQEHAEEYQRLFGVGTLTTTSSNKASLAVTQPKYQSRSSINGSGSGSGSGSGRGSRTKRKYNDVDMKAAASAHDNNKNSNHIVLNTEQNAALQLVLTGRNIYLTGAAGVGKTFLLRQIVTQLQSQGDGDVAVTASTGIAASHIPSGTTLHSWAGIGIGGSSGQLRGDASKLIQKVLNNRLICHRWRTTRTLIIDEISMIDGITFQSLDVIGKAVRRNQNRPFGGLQLVLCGDFYQLPPVSLRYGGFSFSSAAWKNGEIDIAEMKTVVRQKGDLDFISILRKLREGKCSNDIETILATCHVSMKKKSTDGIISTKLYCTNKNVDAENNNELKKLKGESQSYVSIDEFKGRYAHHVNTSLRQSMDKKVPAVIRLKIGAQVMLLKNTPEWKLVNGSRGIVVGFDKKNQNYPLIRFTNGLIHTVTPFETFQANSGGAMTREQLPIKLAWCLTVHKSQGMTIDRLELQLDDAFAYGQVYVALSRVTSLAGLWIKGKAITQKVVKAHPDVIEFHRKIRAYE
jgi:ATP-dependent DNA helicase PIF1